MPGKKTYGDFKQAIDHHLYVISRMQEKLRLKQERLWLRKGSVEATPDETVLSGADEAEMLGVEKSSSVLDPIAEPSELWVC